MTSKPKSEQTPTLLKTAQQLIKEIQRDPKPEGKLENLLAFTRAFFYSIDADPTMEQFDCDAGWKAYFIYSTNLHMPVLVHIQFHPEKMKLVYEIRCMHAPEEESPARFIFDINKVRGYHFYAIAHHLLFPAQNLCRFCGDLDDDEDMLD